jgi:hypothetical protein
VIGTSALVFQAVGIYAVVVFFAEGSHLHWDLAEIRARMTSQLPWFVFEFSYLQFLKPQALMLLTAAGLFSLGRRSGWLVAMLGQCFVLYLCLSLYFLKPAMPAIYPIMISAVVMVLFFNSTGVRSLFPTGFRKAR